MSVKAWPFLVSRSERFEYRPIVVPQFLLEQDASALLAQAVRGDLSDSDIATYREVHDPVVGDFSLIFRVVQAVKQHIGLAGNEPLRDEVGRVILLLEGIVLEGRMQGTVITKGDLQAAHEYVERDYREFWNVTGNVPAIRPSDYFYLQTESDKNKRVDLRLEPPLKVKRRVIVMGATGLIGQALCEDLQERGYTVNVFSPDPEVARTKVPDAAAYYAWNQATTGAGAAAIDGAYAVISLASETPDGLLLPSLEQRIRHPILLTAVQTVLALLLGIVLLVTIKPSLIGALIIMAVALVIGIASGVLFSHPKRTGVKDETVQARESPVGGTSGLIISMAQARVKPKVFVCGSAVSYYGYEGFSDQLMDENAPPGTDFWGRSTVAMEQAAMRAEALGIRTILVRTGIVLDAHEGFLSRRVTQFRRFLGGPILPGTQWFPWIHVTDEVGILLLALQDKRVHGPINATAPEPQRYRDFAKILAKVLGRPYWLPLPEFILKWTMGEAAATVIHGRRIIPRRALELGYQFQYPTSEKALQQLLGKDKQKRK